MNPFHLLTRWQNCQPSQYKAFIDRVQGLRPQQVREELYLTLLRAIAIRSRLSPIDLDWNALWGDESSQPLEDPIFTLLGSYVDWLEGGQA
jgi:hypothetical protein